MNVIADGGSVEVDRNEGGGNDDLVLEEGGVDRQKYFVDGDYASDEYYSPDSSDGEGGTRFKPKFPMFNLKVGKGWHEPVKGMRYANPQQLRECLTSYAVAKGFPIKFDKSSRHSVLVNCATGCPFRLWASYMQNEDSFQIKSLNSEHKCVRNFKLKLVTSKWLSIKYKKKLTSDPNWKLKDFKAYVLEKYAIDVSLSKCFRAKKKALGEVEESLVEHYGKVWDYSGEILRANLYSTIKLSLC